MLPNYPANILAIAKNIKLLICDVDGVLSDGKVYLTNQGDEIKSFNIKDGLGIKLLQKSGIQVAIITGRHSTIVERRAKELGIQHVYQGRSDKRSTFDEIVSLLSLTPAQVAHIGDDLPDLPLMKRAGLGISVADGYEFVREQADWVTTTSGGQGAVREVADLLLHAQQRLDDILDGYMT
ncbi:3-deoxy-manno-octulosonate-8-phosphatase KdsC [Aliikangiella coralliicola]|uniref:3-deoxy-D-manno-octulosonate 8-phosphate phosphatase KdsC n=1 Tax=Aliikangiella coralliicola TaxID=2592383 RepID=A0A545UJZ7_9GAMM|nr:3-deoxy-manno-octulosonate-8-phosphatase KdsC [Aliikangiella coralliicola]TQV89790.1 3-deoxy-manno-octulosonate-8-phosphatase KdsC [Aliikangiella coralliicola]